MIPDRLCKGCSIAQEASCPGGIATLPGGWTVNQYGSGEGWLGWLALQTAKHKLALSELDDQEAGALGPNIKRLDNLLTAYWGKTFAPDRIRRVYVVYFFEGAFQEPEPEPYHLHIHIIPSFESLNVPGGLRRSSGKHTWADGWWVPHLRERGKIPSQYSNDSEDWDHRVAGMMDFLRTELG